MSTKLIGFHGLESYDVMHYVGRVLGRLGCKVLLVDASDDLSLALTMPGHEMQDGEILEYNDVDLARLKVLTTNIAQAYDYILVYSGWNAKCGLLRNCEEVFCFTDSQMQNVKRMKQLKLSSKQCRFLVLRKQVTFRFTDAILSELGHLNFTENNLFTLSDTPTDELCKLQVQYDSNFNFQGISNDMIKLLTFVVETEIDPATFKKTLKKMQKG